MKKFLLIVAGLIIVVALFFGCIHTKYTDYVNPFVKNSVSYAQVSGKKAAGNYKNVVAYSNDGAQKQTLAAVGSYSYGKYIKIYHKGQYVKSISYITKKAYLSHTTKA